MGGSLQVSALLAQRSSSGPRPPQPALAPAARSRIAVASGVYGCSWYLLDGSWGSNDTLPAAARPWRIAYTAGRMVKVAMVATTKPPITALPRGAAWARSPEAIAMGIIPAVMAVAVIRIARRPPRPPSTPDSRAEPPPRRACSQ